jgi:hypothetical protein
VRTIQPNQRVEANRRHASPFTPRLELEQPWCAQPLRSAAVAHPGRSAS